MKNGLSALPFENLFMVKKDVRARGHSLKPVKRRWNA